VRRTSEAQHRKLRRKRPLHKLSLEYGVNLIPDNDAATRLNAFNVLAGCLYSPNHEWVGPVGWKITLQARCRTEMGAIESLIYQVNAVRDE
jgi:hypothetical protein